MLVLAFRPTVEVESNVRKAWWRGRQNIERDGESEITVGRSEGGKGTFAEWRCILTCSSAL